MKKFGLLLLFVSLPSFAGVGKVAKFIAKAPLIVVAQPVKFSVRAVEFIITGFEYNWSSCTDPMDPNHGIAFFNREHGPCVGFYAEVKDGQYWDNRRLKESVQRVTDWDLNWQQYLNLGFERNSVLVIMGQRPTYPNTTIVYYDKEIAKTGDTAHAISSTLTGKPLKETPPFPR